MSWKHAHSKEYMKLIEDFPLIPVRSRKQHSAAISMIKSLSLKETLTQGESDYFHVLARLIKDYEEEIIEPVYVEPHSALEFLMEQNDISQTTIATISGMQKSHISEFLAGKRRLPKKAAARLGARFRVDPMLFLPKIAATPLQEKPTKNRRSA